MPRARLPRALSALTVAVLTGLTLPAPAASATAAVEAPSHAPVEAVPAAAFPTPKPPVTLPAGIEDRATYVPNNSCAATTLPGTTKLAALLQQNYGIGGWAPRDCGLNGAGSVTEHYDGRGYDWYTTVRNANSKAAADHFINWLMATDSAGNPMLKRGPDIRCSPSGRCGDGPCVRATPSLSVTGPPVPRGHARHNPGPGQGVGAGCHPGHAGRLHHPATRAPCTPGTGTQGKEGRGWATSWPSWPEPVRRTTSRP